MKLFGLFAILFGVQSSFAGQVCKMEGQKQLGCQNITKARISFQERAIKSQPDEASSSNVTIEMNGQDERRCYFNAELAMRNGLTLKEVADLLFLKDTRVFCKQSTYPSNADFLVFQFSADVSNNLQYGGNDTPSKRSPAAKK